MAQRDPHQLREEAASAVARGKLDSALALYIELEQLEPTAAAWAKRIGETQRRLGHLPEAVVAFERAVDKYVADGLLVQAIAVCKLILQIAPENATIAGRIAELATPKPAEARAVAARGRTAPQPDPARPVGAVVELARRTAAAPEEGGVRRAAVVSRASLEAKRKPPQVTLPPGAPLDALDLATVMPDSQRLTRPDGTDAGMAILPIEIAFEDVYDEVEIEVVDPKRVALLSTPLFAQLPQATLERLIAKMPLFELAPNEIVFTEGDPGTSLFVISEGEVSVQTGETKLANLAAGSFFGEIALVTDLPRSATVRAIGRVELLGIDRDVLRDAMAERPEIVNVLLGFVRDRLVDRITRTSELFHPFTDDERRQLATKFEVVEVVSGTQMIVFGERADGLYIVLAGRVEVTRDGEPGVLATLGSGDVFGEMSLLANRGSSANVRAATRVLALRLPARTFQEVIMTYPQVLAYLGELSSRRSRLQQAEDFIDLHVDLV